MAGEVGTVPDGNVQVTTQAVEGPGPPARFVILPAFGHAPRQQQGHGPVAPGLGEVGIEDEGAVVGLDRGTDLAPLVERHRNI